ncbi:Sulfatase-modifying factor enzyme 1 [bacterium A37T11]|nr:Sulfatase-modifying factor enzyme 1 [bacterium A37T11]
MKKIGLAAICLLLFVHKNFAQDMPLQGNLKELFAGPTHLADYENWLNRMKHWRSEERKKLEYTDTEYLRPELSWVKTAFIYAQVMAHDRYLYDPVAGSYTVDRYLNDVKNRYGGLDAVMVWPTYPNMGIDDRNQYDLVAAMPGGLEGVRQMVQDFKKRGVRVFFPIMFWDTGTRPIAQAMPEALVAEMKTIGADGLNGDTMLGVTENFKNAYDSLGYPVALQPENNISDLKMVAWNHLSWGYFWNYAYKPGVSIYKWMEPRHQVHVTNRWAVNKTDDLQYAFFNGVGYNTWENIWGIWNQIPDRYAAIIKRMVAIYRAFPQVWSSSSWTPFFPTVQEGIFATAFPASQLTVYTLVNRDSLNKFGKQLILPYQKGMSYYDLWNGSKLTPYKKGNKVLLGFPIVGNGFGAVLSIPSRNVNDSIRAVLTQLQILSKISINSLSASSLPLSQHLIDIPKTASKKQVPEGMVLIPAVKGYNFESKGIMIEGDELPESVGIQHPWEKHPARSQKHVMDIDSFYMDQFPVTNRQFKEFMDSSHYQPKDTINFLSDWKNESFPDGWEEKPVTWVSLEDARAYAAWAGKRLPHEWEWQYTAQNHEVMDMTGKVWQWTDEYQDEHTRAAILKGGSSYVAKGSKWYFPQVHDLNEYGKYLLMSPGIDRAGTIGFRCVADR